MAQNRNWKNEKIVKKKRDNDMKQELEKMDKR